MSMYKNVQCILHIILHLEATLYIRGSHSSANHLASPTSIMSHNISKTFCNHCYSNIIITGSSLSSGQIIVCTGCIMLALFTNYDIVYRVVISGGFKGGLRGHRPTLLLLGHMLTIAPTCMQEFCGVCLYQKFSALILIWGLRPPL